MYIEIEMKLVENDLSESDLNAIKDYSIYVAADDDDDTKSDDRLDMIFMNKVNFIDNN